jgi:hypothetical protein
VAESRDSTRARHPGRGRGAAPSTPPLPPAEVLLHRIAVVEGEHAAELVSGLNEAGLPARSVGAGKLHGLIAGLVVFEEHTEPKVVAEALRLLRRRQTPAWHPNGWRWPTLRCQPPRRSR